MSENLLQYQFCTEFLVCQYKLSRFIKILEQLNKSICKHAPATTGNRLRSVLIRGCTREENRDYPNYQWGFGTLNLIEAFNSLREN